MKEFETTGAAAKEALPAWLALTVQVPVPASVSVVPLTVHTLAVVDAKDTARPELDVATSAMMKNMSIRLGSLGKGHRGCQL